MPDRRQAQVLDACLNRLLSGSASVEELLSDYPGEADWLGPLLRSAQQARLGGALPPMAEAVRLAGERRLRSQMRRAAQRGTPARHRTLRPAFAILSIAVAFLLLGSASGMAYAAEASLPGDNLYPIKQAIEQVQLAIAQAPQDQAQLLVELSEERLREAGELAARGRPEDMPAALEGYGKAVERLVGLTDQLPVQDEGASLQAIAGQLGRQEEVLRGLQAAAPAAAQQGLMQALEHSNRNREAVEQIIHTREREPGPPAGRGPQATQTVPQTPGAGRDKDKDPGKGQGRGRPTEKPSD